MSDPEDVGDEAPDEVVTEAGFARLLEKLSNEYNFDFREYKRASLARRIKARMQQVRLESFERYAEYLDRHADEHVALFNTILINVTSFFRDPQAWSVLANEVAPHLIEQASESRSMRVWSIGCSSGEEAYSAAIVLAEALGGRSQDLKVKISAPDVDDEALGAARQALYRVEDVKDVPTTLLEQYSTREGQTYRFRRDLRRWCIFGRHNVVQDPPLSHIDLVICRNVLIYFTNDLQDKIIARFHYATREGGYLFLGRSESLLARSRWFAPLNLKWRIFQRTTAPAPTVAMGMLRNDLAMPATPPATREAAPAITRLQRVIETLPSAIMVVDAMDNVLVWNAAAEALYDLPGDNALNRKFRDLDISYRIEGLRARLEGVKSKHIPSRLDDVTFTRRSGQLVHVEISIIPLVENNRVVAVIVFASEATETARLRDQMARVAEQHATAIEELQSTNEELETTNEELQSTNEELETTNEELQSTNEELETTVEELQAANAELGAMNTERERRAADLRQLDSYQRNVLNSLDHPIVVLDRESKVTTWNQSAEEMWALRADHAVGRPLWSLPIGEMPRLVREALGRVLANGHAERVANVPFVTPSHDGRRAALRLAPLRDGGEVVGVVMVGVPEDSGG